MTEQQILLQSTDNTVFLCVNSVKWKTLCTYLPSGSHSVLEVTGLSLKAKEAF